MVVEPLVVLLLLLVPLSCRTLYDHIVQQRVQVTGSPILAATTFARLLCQDGVLYLIGNGAASIATTSPTAECALECANQRPNRAVCGGHICAAATTVSSSATSTHQMMSATLPLRPELWMLLLNVSLHVGAEREPCGAMLTGEWTFRANGFTSNGWRWFRPLPDVAAAVTAAAAARFGSAPRPKSLPRSSPRAAAEPEGTSVQWRERWHLQRVVQLVQLEEVHWVEFGEGVVEQLELLLLLGEIDFGKFRHLCTTPV
uniref:Secreted protein n=1 Tax=Anopheles maculatus TaxID=74869 RepID=A0A182T413_9DIPT